MIWKGKQTSAARSKHRVRKETCKICTSTCDLASTIRNYWFMHWRVSKVLNTATESLRAMQKYEIRISFSGFGIASDIELGITFM